jgi:hypothetical protein
MCLGQDRRSYPICASLPANPGLHSELRLYKAAVNTPSPAGDVPAAPFWPRSSARPSARSTRHHPAVSVGTPAGVRIVAQLTGVDPHLCCDGGDPLEPQIRTYGSGGRSVAPSANCNRSPPQSWQSVSGVSEVQRPGDGAAPQGWLACRGGCGSPRDQPSVRCRAGLA